MSSECNFDWDGGPADYEPPPFSPAGVATAVDEAPSALRQRVTDGDSEEAQDAPGPATGWTLPRWNPPTETAPIWSPTMWPPPIGSLPIDQPITITQSGSSKARNKMRRMRMHLHAHSADRKQ
jgi:hypothetical protein